MQFHVYFCISVVSEPNSSIEQPGIQTTTKSPDEHNDGDSVPSTPISQPCNISNSLCIQIAFITIYHIFIVLEQVSIGEQIETEAPIESRHDLLDGGSQSDQNATTSTLNGQSSSPVAPNIAPTQSSVSIEEARKKGPPYICDCGYDCKRKIARLINHQREGACPNHPRTAPLIPCPVCTKPFTFSGLKSHLAPFVKESSRGTYSHEHSQLTVENHKRILEEVKLKHAPKRLKLSVN